MNPRVPSNKPFGARRSVVAEAPSPRVASSRHGTRSIAMAESSHGVGPDGMKKRDEDSDDGVEFSPFWGIEKGAVLQEARCFNESQLDARKCQQVITKLLYLTNQGETFTKVSAAPGPRGAPTIPSEPAAPVAADDRGGVRAGPSNLDRALARVFSRAPGSSPAIVADPRRRPLPALAPPVSSQTEATEVFFSVTKLFQSKDSNLRRMVYLIIKEICPSENEVIIVTSSLMKDMNSKIDLYRANAIRVLCAITDAPTLSQIERYLKQAVVDKNAVVSSAALVSGIHLLENVNADIVRRWSNEVQEAVNSKSPTVQFHALALLYSIRANDRLAVSKLVTQLTRSSIRSPLAQCLVIRYVARVVRTSVASEENGGERPFYDFLESCLRHKSEMVIFEAARAIVELNEVTSRELQPAITVLQLFLSSSKPTLRFAAMRALGKVALTHPLSVSNCNIDMESLISDSNRSIATLAITTLLKTGNESSVDRLMKQITAFMADIQDEFKIVVVEAIQSLCLKYPAKHRVLMNFLSNILREEGGFEFKRAIVDSILCLIKEIPDAKESGLGHLSEFIEDCEFTYLSSQILHLLGDQGPSTKDPSKYIRYIYNRVILENATIRASAVCALAKFGAECPALLPRVLILLRRCLYDNDDEVRDRAAFFVSALQDQQNNAASEAASGEGEADELAAVASSKSSSVIFACPLGRLEASLRAYVDAPSDAAFDVAAVDHTPEEPTTPKRSAHGGVGGGGGGGDDRHGGGVFGNAPAAVRADEALEKARAEVAGVPEFASFGAPFKSCPASELTEDETEYKVSCFKHVFENHLVFQFKCANTIEEQVLEDVSVLMEAIEGEGDVFEEVATVPLASMPLAPKSGSTFVAFRFAPGAYAAAKFACVLKFTSKEVDPSTGEPEEDGYDDEYTLEDADVAATDFVNPVPTANFRKTWDELPPETERSDDYGLGTRESLEEAVEAVMQILGMTPCEGTEAVPPNARSHAVLLSGRLCGRGAVLLRMNLGIDAGGNVAMKLAARAETEDAAELVHTIISNA